MMVELLVELIVDMDIVKVLRYRLFSFILLIIIGIGVAWFSGHDDNSF
ncbi:hypothetical protein [Bacillus sp. OTU530]